jgi:hypothetical protein
MIAAPATTAAPSANGQKMGPPCQWAEAGLTGAATNEIEATPTIAASLNLTMTTSQGQRHMTNNFLIAHAITKRNRSVAFFDGLSPRPVLWAIRLR